MAARGPTLGHCRGDSLTNPKLATLASLEQKLYIAKVSFFCLIRYLDHLCSRHLARKRQLFLGISYQM